MKVDRSMHFIQSAASAFMGAHRLNHLIAATKSTNTDGWFYTLRQWIGGLLLLDANTFQATVTDETGLLWALAVLLTAGLSVSIGQSVVLFANRVPPRRFLISLLGSAAVGLLAVLFWSVSIWATARILFGVTEAWRNFLIVTALGFAPALFGFTLFMPYLGVIAGWMLRVWVSLTVVVGVGIVGDLPLGPALLCCAPGWLFLESMTRLPLLDLRGLRAWVLILATGRPRRLEGNEIAMWLAEQSRTRVTAGADKEGGF
jgi:hypothetical protein